GSQGLLDFGAVSGEIAFAEQAPGLLAEVADALRHRATIKIVAHRLDARRAAAARIPLLRLGHALKGASEVGLREDLSLLGQAPVRHVHLLGVWPLFEYWHGRGESVCQAGIEGKALGKLNRRLDDFGKAHAPVVFE